VGGDEHGGGGRRVLERVGHALAPQQGIDKRRGVAVAAPETLERLNGEGAHPVTAAVLEVGDGTLFAVLDDDDFIAVTVPAGGGGLVVGADARDRFGEVELLARAEHDVAAARRQRVIDRDLVRVFPGIGAVVDVENYDDAVLFGEHHHFQRRLPRRARAQRRAGDDHGLGAFNVVFVDVVGADLQVRRAVAVHQDAAFGRAEDFGEGQADFFPVDAAENVRGVNAVLLEIVGHVVAELVVGNARDEADLRAQPRQAHGDVRRRAADVLVEVGTFLQRPVEVGRVEVDGDPADGDNVERPVFREFKKVHFRSPVLVK